MFTNVYLSSAALAFGVLLIWRYVTYTDPASIVAANLEEIDRIENPGQTVRQMELERSATERIIGPATEFITSRLRRVTPVSRLESIQHKLVLAGLGESKWTPESILGLKLVLTVLFGLMGAAILSSGLSSGNLMKAGLAVAVGYLVPETLLSRRVNERQTTIQNQLPDVIDQITVSVEAGLGFDAAMQRAGEEGKGPLSEEFMTVVHDLQIGMSREEALDSLLARTSVPDLRQFVLAVRQATRYGLPIARVLRVQSNEMREKRRARAETKAMQVPVKITFPLVFFILPALFIVILGPAAIQLGANNLAG